MEQKDSFVTAMIVVRNEESYIRTAILSLLEQDYPKEKMELLIIDGQSTDRTVEVAKQTVADWSAQGKSISVRYLENPKRILAAGWNLGIREAKGQFVVRIDAHSQADPRLISHGVELLNSKPDVVCVGGRLEARTLTPRGRVISYIQSSPFGVGNSKFRYATQSGYVDTAAYGVYRKSIFEQAGYFNEEFVRNQDNDMHGRIKDCGGKFYLDATLNSIYHPRETIKGMMKQGFGNGKWTVIGWRKSVSKQGISLRHLIPLFFVLANLVLVLGGAVLPLFRWGLLALYVLYFGLAVYFSVQKTRNLSEIALMCAGFWLFHISYGWGSLSEMIHLNK